MSADTASMQGVRETLGAMVRAWDAGDAEAYAECFTVDAAYVIFVGTTYLGREDIADSHRALFEKFGKGTRLQMTVLDERLLTPDVATVVTCGDATRKTLKPGARPKVQSYTFVRTDVGWRCATFQNTQTRTLMERISFLSDRRFKPQRER